jgi:UDP-GlcNAc:undecaprenyl-phosphate GlcNAc-1-phosphate transferase
MAASTLSVVGQTDNAFSGRTYFTFAPIFIPFFILGIPMLDTAFAIIRRAGRRGNPTKPDKDHLHHRLMRLGHGQRRSVMILWAWTALLSALVLYPTFSNNQGNAVIPFGVLTLGVLLYTVFAPSGRRSGALAEGVAENTPDGPDGLDAPRETAHPGRDANGGRHTGSAGKARAGQPVRPQPGPTAPPPSGPAPANGQPGPAQPSRRPDKVGR